MFLGLVYTGVKFITSVLPRQFLIPPQNWRDRIQKVVDHPKPIYLQTGSKRGSFRRRLILASCQPSFYTNFVNNKVKLQPQDSANENDHFLSTMKNRDVNDSNRRLIYGFFHPYANNGGGGERVLWEAVEATLLANDSKNIVAIYTTNIEAQPLEIIDKVKNKFQISLDSSRIVFIYLRKYGNLIDALYWKHFTIVGQLFGSALLSLEALYELSPDVFVDTIGLPGAYLPVSLILKIPIISYVHYPVLQLEMFKKLRFKDFSISSLRNFKFSIIDVKELGKLAYWLILYYFYVYLGSLVDITLTNGTWTNNHIKSIWKFNKIIETLYPPCGDDLGSDLLKKTSERENSMIYVAQFRPEKRHDLILQQYSKFLTENKKLPLAKIPKLIFLGSCRTPSDTSTLEELRKTVASLELDVKFIVDCLYDEVLLWLGKLKYGLNAMWNEHFGIGVVEYLNNGVVPIVHASAGPYLDIVTGFDDNEKEAWKNNTGFFFKDESDPDFNGKFTNNKWLQFGESSFPSLNDLLEEILISKPELSSNENLDLMRENGLKLIDKFSNRKFIEHWMNYISQAEYLERVYRDKRDGIESVY